MPPNPLRTAMSATSLQADRYSYRDEHHLLYFGTYFPESFSPRLAWYGRGEPSLLTIKAAGDGEAVLDGFGANVPSP
jgi:hypothetical protein